MDDLPGAIRDLGEALRVNTLMDIEIEVSCPRRGLPDSGQAVGLFHIAQEALNNVSKHSRATAVSLKFVAADGRVGLEIRDNGTGFDVGEAGATDRHGLRNIKERARSLGADMFIDSKVTQGTTVRVELPLRVKGSTVGE